MGIYVFFFFLAGFSLALAAFLFFSSRFSSFSVFTKRSTVQAMITDVTVSPGFTSTSASPLAAARLRMPAASSLADFGAPWLVWMVTM